VVYGQAIGLGVKYGYTKIPENYAKALFDYQALDGRIEALFAVLDD
jgi:hypothetical protein